LPSHRLDRRRFLAQAAALSAGSAIIDRALALPADRRTGTLMDVQHIVVLTQENRSFDHYFGGLNGVRGFADPHPIPLSGGHTVWSQPRAPARGAQPTAAPRLTPYHLNTLANFAWMRASGTPHRWPDAQQAWDHGRMAHWPAAKGDHALSYFGAADLPFQTALANAFTLCDAYHCAIQAGTHPNRYYLTTGTNDPFGQGRGPAMYNDFDDFGPAQGPGSEQGYRWTTYAERLQAAGISWHVYQDLPDNFGDNSLAGFKRFRDAVNGRGTDQAKDSLAARAGSAGGLERLRQDVVAGTLPQVSWIVGTAEGSEHPWKSSPAQGADYTARVIEALTANPQVWARTVLLVNFDENDGFFDHVPPPAPPSARGAKPGVDMAGSSNLDTRGEYHLQLPAGHDNAAEAQWLGRPYGLGPRVPMFVVSPWSRGGWVCSQVYDHTSVIRLMEARFGVAEPNISPWRRAVCGDLTATLDFSTADTARVSLPPTIDLARRARALGDTRTPPPPQVPQAPVQAAGARPARALPYELVAQCHGADTSVTLQLDNPGRAAAVVQVYDRLRLADIPRRFTLASRTQASDAWALDAEGRYDLWLLGPNGWHRQFRGRQSKQDVVASLQVRSGQVGLLLSLRNPGPQRVSLRLRALAYQAGDDRVLSLAAGASQDLALPLDQRHHWYDWALQADGPADESAYLRRWAGHVETGRPSITDPAMQGPAALRSWTGDGPARPQRGAQS
jgi:phospholipase C